MMPEFSDCALLVIDPAMPLHHAAYAIIEYQEELYFRQYIEKDNQKRLCALNTAYTDIALTETFVVKGCIVQQKQRGLPAKHYYKFNQQTKKLEFISKGYTKQTASS